MVKLQKHKAYVYTSGAGVDIPHFKYLITVPEDKLDKLGWEEGEEFEWVLKGDTMVLKPKPKQEKRK